MRSLMSTEIVMFSGLVARTSLRSFGNCTGTELRTTGTVIRKMIKSTIITSTSGVVLMVEIGSSSSPDEPTFIDMVLRPRRCLRCRQQHRMQVGGEAAHALHRGLVAANQPVVAEHCGHRDREADGRHDQRLAHWPGHLVDRRLPGDADRRQRVIDAPHLSLIHISEPTRQAE